MPLTSQGCAFQQHANCLRRQCPSHHNSQKEATSNKATTTMTSSNGNNPTVLVAGGCGYIGTHTIVCLLLQNYDVVVVDNLVNSNAISLEKVAEIVGLSEQEKKKRLVFHKVDICDEEALRKVFESSPKFISCIHFAGLKVLYEMSAPQCLCCLSLESLLTNILISSNTGCR